MARQLVTGKASAINLIVRVIARIPTLLDCVYNSPSSAKFHCPDIDFIGLRLVDAAVGPFY